MSEYDPDVFNIYAHSPSPRRGGAGSLPHNVKIYSFDELKNSFINSISSVYSSAPCVCDFRYISLDKFFDLPNLLGDSSLGSGEKIAHSQYKLQKRLLSALLYARDEALRMSPADLVKSLIDEWDIWVKEFGCRSLSTEEYHKILAENPDLINDYWDIWVKAFEYYLNQTLKTWLHIPFRVAFDVSTGYAFVNAHYLAHPVNQFMDDYKKKKLLTILKFKLVTELLSKVKFTSNVRDFDISVAQEFLSRLDPEKYPHLYEHVKRMFLFSLGSHLDKSYYALLELKYLLDKPLLFITITMGSDHPVITFIKYKRKWNHFFTQLKRLMKKLGWEYRYYVKGVETTKAGRLHVHLVFLGVNPSHDSHLITFKEGLEKLLNRVGFGYINDIQLVKKDYNLLFKSETDLKKEFFDADGNKIREFTILKTFTLPYGGADPEKKEATIHFIKAEPSKKTDNWERIVNYCFKYPLKGETYQDVKDDDDRLTRWLYNNVLFWVFGVKRWLISRDLSRLINTALPVERRFYFFKDEWDFLAWLKGDKSAKLYSTIKDISKFEAFVLQDGVHVEVDALLSHPTIAEVYRSLGLFKDEDGFSPVLDMVRVEGVISPEVLNSLIHYDSFNTLVNLRLSTLMQLTTQKGVVESG